MPLWSLMSIASMMLLGWTDYLYKRAMQSGADGEAVVANVVWFNAPIFLIGGFGVRDIALTSHDWAWGFLGSGVGVWGYVLFAESLERGESGVCTLLFRLNFLVTVVLSTVLLAEPLSAARGVGLGLAILALAGVTAWRPKGRATGATPATSFLYAASAMALFGLGYFFMKVGMTRGADPMGLLITQMIPAFILPATAGALRGRYRINRLNLRYSAQIGLLNSAAVILLFEALDRAHASAAYPISQLSFIVTFIMAVFLLREKMTLPKGAALACSVLAIFALSR